MAGSGRDRRSRHGVSRYAEARPGEASTGMAIFHTKTYTWGNMGNTNDVVEAIVYDGVTFSQVPADIWSASFIPLGKEILEGDDIGIAKTVEVTRPDDQWRKAVLENADKQCEAVDNGYRCSTTTDLEAIHLKPGTRRPEEGAALCPKHKDLAANG
jgi:hypothetical protein